MNSFHVDLQIAAIGKRRTMIIFAKIYRFKYFFCNKVKKMIIKSRFSYKQQLKLCRSYVMASFPHDGVMWTCKSPRLGKEEQ